MRILGRGDMLQTTWIVTHPLDGGRSRSPPANHTWSWLLTGTTATASTVTQRSGEETKADKQLHSNTAYAFSKGFSLTMVRPSFVQLNERVEQRKHALIHDEEGSI